jgi:hypothetical protein
LNSTAVTFLLYKLKFRHNRRFYKQIIYYDCQFYDSTKTTPEDYFNKKASIKDNLETPRIPIASSEGTKETNNVITLKENKAEDDTESNRERNTSRVFNNYINVTTVNQHGGESLEEANNNEYTIHDYEELSNKERLIYDKRSCKEIFRDELILHNSIISLSLKRSFYDPFFIRLLNFTFMLIMQFSLSALVFTDRSLDNRLKSSNRVLLN